jgi:hypothetical protein
MDGIGGIAGGGRGVERQQSLKTKMEKRKQKIGRQRKIGNRADMGLSDAEPLQGGTDRLRGVATKKLGGLGFMRVKGTGTPVGMTGF